MSESWSLWQVVPVALVLAGPFVAGAFYGYAAIRGGDRTGWVGLIVHLAMTVAAVATPISESISSESPND